MSNKFYIAGPMRGIPHSNAEAFAEASQRLRMAGYEVFSPSEGQTEPATNETFAGAMKALLPELLKCDAVALLPGWAKSEGAKLEVLVAISTGKPVYAYFQHRPQYLEQMPTLKIITRAEALPNG
jgi:nucleoside 2-deoxyribosyltransferase